MSEKNKLQEYCQKNKFAMPIYQSYSEGPPHKLRWSSQVTLEIDKEQLMTKTNNMYDSKVASEKEAAYLMLNMIKNKKNSQSKNDITPLNNKEKLPIINSEIVHDLKIDHEQNNDFFSQTKDQNFLKIYLIDLENKPCFKKNVEINNLYIGFINSIHHSVSKYDSWHLCKTDDINKEITSSNSNKLLYLIDGGTPDLVDHFITLFIYPLINYLWNVFKEKNFPTIVIISSDHAGWCTRICLEKVLKWHKFHDIEIENSNQIK